MKETPQETIDRILNEAAELREKVDRNAELYRRDLQYAVDLMRDVSGGEISLETAAEKLNYSHERGRTELESWRATEDQGVSDAS